MTLAVLVQGRTFLSFMVIHLIQHLQSGGFKSKNANSTPGKIYGIFLSNQQDDKPKLLMSVVIPVLCSDG